MGSRRMRAALPEWLRFYPVSEISTQVKEELTKMSEKTIDRYLKKARLDFARSNNSGTLSATRKLLASVPIRDLTFVPTSPGHLQLDTVLHCGSSLTGSYALTLTFTDIATNWTENYAIWTKKAENVFYALQEMEKRLPFPIKAIFPDNGTEFINELVIEEFARSRNIGIYRSRPYRKNDQCYVEQKTTLMSGC